MKAFDICSQAVADTAAIHLKDPDGAPLYDADGKPLRIIVYGPGSAPFAAVEARQTARAVKRMQDNDNKVSVSPPEQLRQERAEDLAAITVAFENFAYPPAGDAQGEPLFRAFYADPRLGYMAQQVLKAVGNWGNFKAASAAN